jgi:hypothetical protein
MHLALMYVTVVSSLPAMGDTIHSLMPKDWLEALGLWQPSVHSIAPVLGLLLLVSEQPSRAFAHLSLNRRYEQGTHILLERRPFWHFVHWLDRADVANRRGC